MPIDLYDIDNIDNKKYNFKVHISIQQRTSKKYITNVSGLPDMYDLPKILKYIKKIYKCGGSVVKDKDDNHILQITGDQRSNIEKFFVEYNVMDKDNIISHGF
jgi:translation initiation factor SUI1